MTVLIPRGVQAAMTVRACILILPQILQPTLQLEARGKEGKGGPACPEVFLEGHDQARGIARGHLACARAVMFEGGVEGLAQLLGVVRLTFGFGLVYLAQDAAAHAAHAPEALALRFGGAASVDPRRTTDRDLVADRSGLEGEALDAFEGLDQGTQAGREALQAALVLGPEGHDHLLVEDLHLGPHGLPGREHSELLLAANFAERVSRLEAESEAERERLKKPLLQRIKAIDGAWVPVIDCVDKAKAAMKKAVGPSWKASGSGPFWRPRSGDNGAAHRAATQTSVHLRDVRAAVRHYAGDARFHGDGRVQNATQRLALGDLSEGKRVPGASLVSTRRAV